MKGIKLSKVNFLQPVTINFRGTSRGERFVTYKQVDVLEFVSTSLLRIVLKGNVLYVPMVNIMSFEELSDEDNTN